VSKKVKLKVHIAVNGTYFVTQLRSVTCHIWSIMWESRETVASPA